MTDTMLAHDVRATVGGLTAATEVVMARAAVEAVAPVVAEAVALAVAGR